MAVVHGIQIPERTLDQFCQKNGIRKLSLFGSILREDFRPDSDIDVLVEFDHDRTPGLLGLARMERELSELLGRKVDLRTAGFLSRYFRDKVVGEALVQYERA
ncbi:MAG: nucleotidyltransferase family protein [Bryobacteraceae bacterium]